MKSVISSSSLILAFTLSSASCFDEQTWPQSDSPESTPRSVIPKAFEPKSARVSAAWFVGDDSNLGFGTLISGSSYLYADEGSTERYHILKSEMNRFPNIDENLRVRLNFSDAGDVIKRLKSVQVFYLCEPAVRLSFEKGYQFQLVSQDVHPTSPSIVVIEFADKRRTFDSECAPRGWKAIAMEFHMDDGVNTLNIWTDLV